MSVDRIAGRFWLAIAIGFSTTLVAAGILWWMIHGSVGASRPGVLALVFLALFAGPMAGAALAWTQVVRPVLDKLAAAVPAETVRLQTTIIDSSPNAVVVSDGQGRILSLNPAATRLFAGHLAQLQGSWISDLIRPASLEAAAAGRHYRNALEVFGERLDIDAQRCDGSPFPAEISVHRVGSGSETLFAAFFRDLTDQRAADAAQEAHQQRMFQSEKLSAMGSLLAGVAHELNNPLAILVTQATLLREKAPTPDVARRAERIHAAAQRAGRIVKSFLAMARQKAPVREPVQLNDVIETALELVGYGLRSAGIAVERHLDRDLPLVEADRDLFGQVFVNLFLNAQQALLEKADPRRIRITTAETSEGVVVTIEDNGSGVPADIRDRVFEPYFTTKPAGAGTGIGLSICASVVAAHAGTIVLGEGPDGGAAFRVVLPRSLAAPATVGPAEGDAGPGLSILVVDDEADVGEALAELLDIFGHRTVVLSSAMDALDRIRQQRFDVVFTDLRMPGMNGLSLRTAIKAVDQRLAGRTVIMTGDTVMGPQRERSAASGDGPVLEKPFSAQDVRAVLVQLGAS